MRRWLNLLYQAGERTNIRAAWGEFYQPQQINELQVEDGINHFFRAQLAEQWVLAFEHQTESGLSFRAEAYDKQYEHLRPYFENAFFGATENAEMESDRFRVSPEGGRARGLEVGLRGGLEGQLRWWANYTRSSSEDRVDGQWVKRSWDQPHAFSAGLDFRLFSWDVNLAWRYHSGWPKTPLSYGDFVFDNGVEANLPIIGERNTARWSDYSRFDMRASRNIPVPRGELRFYLEFINIFDRVNECCVDSNVFLNNQGKVIYFAGTEDWLPFVRQHLLMMIK